MIEKLKAAIEDYIARASEAIHNGEIVVKQSNHGTHTTYRIHFKKRGGE